MNLHDFTTSKPRQWRVLGRLVSAILTLMLVMVLAPTLMASGTAWIRLPDSYYLKITAVWLTADQEFDVAGNRRGIFSDTVTFRDGQFGMTEIGFNGELGITDWLTGVASTRYMVVVREARYRRNGRDTTLSSSGLGDLWLGGRVRLLGKDDPVFATATVSVKVPMGSPKQSIPLGTGLLDYELALAAGSNFTISEKLHGYGQLAGGFRLRNGVSNEFNYAAEAGVNVMPALLVQGLVDGTISTAEFTATPDADQSIRTLIGEQTFARWNLALIYSASPTMDLTISYGRHIAGRNTLASGSFALGIAWLR